MPNRYEREIEEILRNLEQTEPKPGLGQKFSERLRKRPGPRIRERRSRSIAFHLSTPEWLLLITIIVALVAGGYAYAQGEADLFTGVVATVGVVCLILVALSYFIFRPGQGRSTRYGNITVTPLRRSPLNGIKTQWNLLMLKMRYRRRNMH